MTNASELLPCPFCGGEAVLENYITEAAVYCGQCFVRTKAAHAPNEDTGITQAKQAWNTRQVTQLEAQLAEVREALRETRRELWFCAQQLAAHGQEGSEGDSVDRALKKADALLTQSKEPK